jgi:hypothetical protein
MQSRALTTNLSGEAEYVFCLLNDERQKKSIL